MGINLDVTLLIFLRVTGFIFLNDITGRKAMPMIAKTIICIAISYCFINIYDKQMFVIDGMLEFTILAIKEVLIGLILGFIINSFLSVIIIGGEIADFHIGLSIAKIYDAQTNVSMPISASIINVMFFLVFFAMNGHLTLISILKSSFDIIAVGKFSISPQIFYDLCALFSQILLLGLKIVQPIMAIMLLSEIGMAIIMRTIPQINVFTINIQVKLILGMILIFILIPVFINSMEQLTYEMFDNINFVVTQIGKG